MKKAIVLFLLMSLTTCMTCACGSERKETKTTLKEQTLESNAETENKQEAENNLETENKQETESSTDTVSNQKAEAEEQAESEQTKKPGSSMEETDYSWIDSYIDFLRNFDVAEYSNAEIIYVNDDDIPEIIFMGNNNSLGSIVLTIGADNSVKYYKCLSAYSVHYVPKKNVLYSYNAAGGGADEEIICIEDGDWKTLFFGTYDLEKTSTENEFSGTNYNIYEKGYYEFGAGTSVSEEEYNNAIKMILLEKAYNKVTEKEIEAGLGIDEIFDELKKLRPE